MTPLQVTTRPAIATDTEFACLVHHRAYRDVVTRQYGAWPEDKQDEFFAISWSEAAHEIILCNDVPCGYVCVEDGSGELYLREFVVDPESQGKGIGTEILRQVIERARAHQVSVRLKTHRVNRAVSLYLRLGFREYARTESHILMEWSNG